MLTCTVKHNAPALAIVMAAAKMGKKGLGQVQLLIWSKRNV
jgi:hypothetical protein